MQLPDLSLLLMMALFWATFFVLKAFVLNPLGRILEAREHDIASAAAKLDRARADQEAAMVEVDRRLTEARREILATRESLRAESAARRQKLLDDAREVARGKSQEAQRTLEQEIATAREELRLTANETAAELAGAALGRKVA